MIDAGLNEFVSMFFEYSESLFLFTDGEGRFSAVSPDSHYKISSILGEDGVFRLCSFGKDGYILLHGDTAYRFNLKAPGDADE